MTNHKPSSIQNDVMNKIHSGTVRMRPRVYFTILWLAGIVATVAAGILVAYLMGMLMYIVRIQTASTPAYGARENLSQAIATFPWWAVVVAVGFAAGAIWLMRRNSRLYRYSIGKVITVFLAIVLLLGIGLSYTSIGRSNYHNSGSSPSGQHSLGGGRSNAGSGIH